MTMVDGRFRLGVTSRRFEDGCWVLRGGLLGPLNFDQNTIGVKVVGSYKPDASVSRSDSLNPGVTDRHPE